MARVELRPWSADDLPLLTRLLGDPNMTEHLGGPETPAQLEDRQRRYLALPPPDVMFVILADGVPAGSVGYWARDWRDEAALECGWAVLPGFQGQGVAGRAVALLLSHAHANGGRRWLHAFPNVDNAASNALCQKCGFTLLGATEFEYPKGHHMQVNDWVYDLYSGQSATTRPNHPS